jgi:nucleoside phosphorylase
MESIKTIDNKITSILYVVVMPEESNAILDKGKFEKNNSLQEYENVLEAFTTKTDDFQIHIIRPLNDPLHNTGLFGTEIAFFITYIGIKYLKPDIVISLGYAGDTGIGEKLPLGTIVIAEEKSLYHRRNMIVKVMENTSHGHYPVLSCNKMIKDLNYINAKVGTSNSFVHHDHIAFERGIKVVEMELCSVARACMYFNIPCIGVKIISDCGEENCDIEEREKQFLESLELLRKTFYLAYDEISHYILGKNIKDL